MVNLPPDYSAGCRDRAVPNRVDPRHAVNEGAEPEDAAQQEEVRGVSLAGSPSQVGTAPTVLGAERAAKVHPDIAQPELPPG